MKTDICASIRLLLAFVVGEMLAYVAADSQMGNANYADYYNNNYGHYGEPYDTGDPGIPPPDVPESRYPTTIACFVCTLVKRTGVPNQGMDHCEDPFNRLDIPSVDCKGPCAKLFHQHGEGDTMISRSCLPNCVEHRDDRSYTQCCHDPYCNTARSTYSASLALSAGLVLLTLWISRR